MELHNDRTMSQELWEQKWHLILPSGTGEKHYRTTDMCL